MNHSRNSVRKLTMLALLTAMSIVFARVLQQYVSQIRHLQRTSLWLEMYLSSSVIPWDFMAIIRNMQSS